MFRSYPVHISLHLPVDHFQLISDLCTVRFTGCSAVPGSDLRQFCSFFLQETLVLLEYTVILRSPEGNATSKIGRVSTDTEFLVVTQQKVEIVSRIDIGHVESS